MTYKTTLEGGVMEGTIGSGVLSVLGVDTGQIAALVRRLTGGELVSLVQACAPVYMASMQVRTEPSVEESRVPALAGCDLKTDISFSSSVSARVAGGVLAPEVGTSVASGQTYTRESSLSPRATCYLELLQEQFQERVEEMLGNRASYAAILGLPRDWFGNLRGKSLVRADDGSLVYGERGVLVHDCLTAVAVGAVSVSWEFPVGSLGESLSRGYADEWMLRKSPGLSDEFGGSMGRPPGKSSDKGFCYRLWHDTNPSLADLGPWPTGRDLHARGIRVSGLRGESYYSHADYAVSVPVYCVVGAEIRGTVREGAGVSQGGERVEPPYVFGGPVGEDLSRGIEQAVDEWREGDYVALRESIHGVVAETARATACSVHVISVQPVYDTPILVGGEGAESVQSGVRVTVRSVNSGGVVRLSCDVSNDQTTTVAATVRTEIAGEGTGAIVLSLVDLTTFACRRGFFVVVPLRVATQRAYYSMMCHPGGETVLVADEHGKFGVLPVSTYCW